MAVISEIAKAVLVEIRQRSWSVKLTCSRAYLPEKKLAELQGTHVTVVPKARAAERFSRAGFRKTYDVDVAVQQKVDKDDLDEIDKLMGLVEELEDYFKRGRLSQYQNAIFTKSTNEPVYWPDHLNRLGVFTSVLCMTFEAS